MRKQTLAFSSSGAPARDSAFLASFADSAAWAGESSLAGVVEQKSQPQNLRLFNLPKQVPVARP